MLYMTKIEVEHRGKLTKKKYLELKSFLKEKGTFLCKNKRFSIIYSQREEKRTEELCDSPIDLKLRVTNKKEELVMKYGKWSGNDARKEFCFALEKGKFDEMVEFLKILGHFHGVLQATNTDIYHYKGLDFSLVDVPNWGYYFEAEAVVSSSEVEKANRKIGKVCEELGISVLDHQGFCELLKSLNDRPGYHFNFKKQEFSDIKKKFKKYF